MGRFIQKDLSILINQDLQFKMLNQYQLIFANTDFRIVVTDIQLASADGKITFMKPLANDKWVTNVSSGDYKLYIKTEYSPSNDDVAYFIDRIHVQNGRSINNINNQSQTVIVKNENTNIINNNINNIIRNTNIKNPTASPSSQNPLVDWRL